MPEIILTDVTKRWGNFYAVDHLTMTIEDNAFVTLLGPSGCGKTTTLRMIAGLETPTSGRITIGDRVVFDSEQGINIPANKRRVGFLFQNYALWPNMTVYQNISFGLTNIKEEMPKVNFKAKTAQRKIEILADPKKLAALINDSTDKDGKLNRQRAVLKMIDTYEISIYTAKELLELGVHEGKDPAGEIARLQNLVDGERSAAEAKGFTLNENFEFEKGGAVVTKVRKLSKEEVDLAVRRVSRIVKIGMFMDRYPAELSGGQQQRVAIARTLAPEPTVLFMDEPLSNLDAKLRLEMRSELQRLHLDTGSTFVYVTHDQMEAMTLATKICLLDNGVLRQYDAPLTVYRNPSDTFVADFVGSPAINFAQAHGEAVDGGIELTFLEGVKGVFRPTEPLDLAEWVKCDYAKDREIAEWRAELLKDKRNVEKGNKDTVFKCHIAKVDETEFEEEHPAGDNDFILGIRPEAIQISEKGKISAEVYSSMPTGMETTVRLRVGKLLLTGVSFGKNTFALEEKVRFDFGKSEVVLFSARSGRLVSTGTLEL